MKQGAATDLVNAGGSFENQDPTYSSTEYTVSGSVTNKVCGSSSCTYPADSGVTVLVTGTASNGNAVNQSAVSAAVGSWSAQVPPGSYTAGPTQDGSTFGPPGFTPASQAVTVSDQDVTGVDFVAPSHKISGTIVHGCGDACSTKPKPIANALVAISGPDPVDAMTGPSGTFLATVPDGSYTVKPSLDGYTFTPPAKTVKVAGADVPRVDFTGCNQPSDPGIHASVRFAVLASQQTATAAASGCKRITTTAITCQRVTFVREAAISEGSLRVTVHGAAPAQTPTGAIKLSFTPAASANLYPRNDHWTIGAVQPLPARRGQRYRRNLRK